MKHGYEAMKAWDKSYSNHHLPQWIKKAIRRDGAMMEPYQGRVAKIVGACFTFWPCVEFDHWGTIKRNGSIIVITQPFHRNDAGAKEFAERCGCELEITVPGPWHPDTVMYSYFLPNV